MKLLKHFFGLLAVALAVAGPSILLEQSVAANGVSVVVDGRFVSFGDVTAQIINERTMVPVRALADELGAQTEWNEETSSVLLTRGNRYATLRIGSPVMLYGEFTRGSGGELSATSTETLSLDSPPIILEERALFPLGAIVSAFDVQFEWVAESRTVVISTEGVQGAGQHPEPDLSGLPTVTPPSDTHPAFADVPDAFLQISGSHAQALRNSNQQFAIVIFDNQDEASVLNVPMLRDAAASAGYRLYGFDVRGSQRFSNPESFSWPWEVTSRGQYPILVFSFRDGQYQVVRDFPANAELVAMFENITRDFPVLPSAGQQPAGENVEAPGDENYNEAAPGDTQQVAFSWNSMTYAQSQERFMAGDSFIVFFYAEDDGNLELIRNMVRRLGENHRVPVHYVNMNTASAVTHAPWTDNFGTMRTPSLFVVRNRNHVLTNMGLSLDHERQLNSVFSSFRQHLEALSQ